jgi:hypothetical protein
MVAAPQVGDRLKDLQPYILVAIPLAGILANTALFIHLSDTMSTRFAGLESKMDSRPHPCRGPDGYEAVTKRATPIRHRDANGI